MSVIKPVYEIQVCSLCGQLLEDDRDYGTMPVAADCPERCGHDDVRGGPMRRFKGEALTIRVVPEVPMDH